MKLSHTSARALRALTFGLLGPMGLILAMADNSEAGLAALAGSAASGSDASCFTHSNGRITNGCTTDRQFCVAPAVTTTGTSKRVLLTSFLPTAGTYQCIAKSLDKFGVTITSTGNVNFTTTGAATEWEVGRVDFAATSDSAFVCCTMKSGGRLNSVRIE